MSEVLNKIRKELDAFEKKKKALIEELRKEFPNMFKEVIEKAKTFETLSWTQYTPYFNDGEECVFSAHIDYLIIDDEYDDSRPELKRAIFGVLDTQEKVDFSNEYDKNSRWFRPRSLGDSGYIKNPNFDTHDGEIYQTIKSTLKEIPEDFLKELFGDHAKVILKKDGTIEVEEYEHN